MKLNNANSEITIMINIATGSRHANWKWDAR